MSWALPGEWESWELYSSYCWSYQIQSLKSVGYLNDFNTRANNKYHIPKFLVDWACHDYSSKLE